MNRRDFLLKSTIGAATLGISPLSGANLSSVLGSSAPSNKIKVALIGCKGMGWSNLNTFLQFPEVECISLCDVDDQWLNKRAKDV
ncbi:MAG: twin-arginine translocation signal domain-containing protein, partial [Tannerellaceae bacterium]